MTPRRLFAALALAEVVTWTLLLAGMFLKYVTRTTDVGVSVAGPLHGFVFLAYCLCVVVIAVDARWSARRALAGLVSGVVPYLTVPFERAADRAGVLPTTWRLRHEEGSGRVERLLGRALRAPLPAAGVAVAALAVVFGLLLAVGPPTELAGR